MQPMLTNNQPSRTSLIRRGLLLVILGLVLATAWLFYNRPTQYQVQTFATQNGWGYTILNNGKPFIHQPTIPGQSGMVGFANQAQARRVGERVVEKIQQNTALPTLTTDELRQLGVTIP